MNRNLGTRQSFRLGYTDLQNANGTLKENVLADISVYGMAPVLKNPFCQYAFVNKVRMNVNALHTKNPDRYMYPTAIMLLKELGYYCEQPPKGLFAKLKWYVAFMEKLKHS